MIRNDSEMKETLRRIEEHRSATREYERNFASMGLSPSEVEEAMAPMVLLRMQMESEVEAYKRLKDGDLGGSKGIRDLGRYLVQARIARGLTLRDLAQKLGVDESSVSRDERNEYHGITLERACRILEALEIEASIVCRLRLTTQATVLSFTPYWNNYFVESASKAEVHINAVSAGVVRSASCLPGVPVNHMPPLGGAA